jgi:hypothetical protein
MASLESVKITQDTLSGVLDFVIQKK